MSHLKNITKKDDWSQNYYSEVTSRLSWDLFIVGKMPYSSFAHTFIVFRHISDQIFVTFYFRCRHTGETSSIPPSLSLLRSPSVHYFVNHHNHREPLLFQNRILIPFIKLSTFIFYLIIILSYLFTTKFIFRSVNIFFSLFMSSKKTSL